MDLVTLSHAELIAVIQHLEATVAAQAATIQRLEQRLRELDPGGGPPRGMPGHKPAQAVPAERRPRRARATNPARPRSEPTARVVHVLEHCPTCGLALAGGSVKRTREVIEITPVPASITEHVYLERGCPGCGRRWTPRVDLVGEVVGQSRLGVGLVSLIATMRSAWRLPVRTIQQGLASLYGLRLSTGAIHGALGQLARAGQAQVDATLAAIRASPVVQADETGWRENGRNRYLWTFSTPTHCYVAAGSRAKGMVDTVLGPDCSGVLVSDFYAAYDHDDGWQQQCWVHLLRDNQTLVRAHPADARLAHWADGVQAVYRDALTQAAGLTARAAGDDERRAVRQACEARLWSLCAPFAGDETAVQATLCRRIDKYRHALFTFVRQAGVPAHNAGDAVRHVAATGT
jgi:transposase